MRHIILSISMYIMCVILYFPSRCTLCASYYTFHLDVHYVRHIILSISMCIMCVILYLFSALCHRIGALQMSLIIIKIINFTGTEVVSGVVIEQSCTALLE